MRFHYVSPSLLPSRAANAVHVMMQCEGLRRAGVDVTVYARRDLHDSSALPGALAAAYGVDCDGMELVTCYGRSPRATVLRIATLAHRRLPRSFKRGDAVLSRNLYAAFDLAVLQRHPILFETHQLETGLRKRMQRAVMTQSHVTTVVISNRLHDYLETHHGVAPATALVLHDAARDGIRAVPAAERRGRLANDVSAASRPWDAVCGYFGHLYEGRGIEIIEAMARRRPRSLFLVFGGNDADVAARRSANRSENLLYLGHVPHPDAQRAMTLVDMLLMPYQQSVSIGIAGHDTARWMSPMKMFEYMASGVPLISSDLPVLREILTDGVNGLLVPPSDVDGWIAAHDRLTSDANLAAAIGATAHADYLEHHTWTRRAERLIAAGAAK